MDYFPNTVATGGSFCDRVKERKLLKNHIESNIHTVILGTRRIGKTSLIKQVLWDSGYVSCEVDMTTVYSRKDVENTLLKAISRALSPILPKYKQALSALLKILNFLNPEITLSAIGQQIRFNPNFAAQPNNIIDILNIFDNAAQHFGKKIVLIMDEFQEIGRFSDYQIEASIRSAMQVSKNICYIFLGSNRQMMQNMFSDKKRPFYNSCDFLRVNRINSTEYIPFIQNAARNCFGRKLDEAIIRHILCITENHTYYVNAICRYFWINKAEPTIEKIDEYWNDYIESRKSFYSSDFIALSVNQKKLFSYYIKNLSKEFSSQNLCSETGLSITSLRQAYLRLMELDMIYKDTDDYIKIVDPGMKHYLKNY